MSSTAAQPRPLADGAPSPRPAAPAALHVPALRDDSGGRVVVTRWGRVAGHTLRAGDRLLIGPEQEGGLLLLRPRGFGWPMLGRRAPGGLVAEPGGVPASALRWQAVGGLLGVQRALDGAVLDDGPWWLDLRVRAIGGGSWRPAAGAAGPGGPLPFEAAQARLKQAVELSGREGVEVAACASRDPRRLTGLVAAAAAGALLIDLHGSPPAGELVEGPWVSCAQGAQLSLFGQVSAGRRAG